MTFLKIKFDGLQVYLEWVDDAGREESLKCRDEPAEDFRAALADLAGDCIAICEIKKSTTKEAMSVRSVTFVEISTGGRAFLISAVRSLSSGKSKNELTPISGYLDPDLPDGCADRLAVLETAAHAYVLKIRKVQLELFEEA